MNKRAKGHVKCKSGDRYVVTHTLLSLILLLTITHYLKMNGLRYFHLLV